MERQEQQGKKVDERSHRMEGWAKCYLKTHLSEKRKELP
jgi:hypothetical protein